MKASLTRGVVMSEAEKRLLMRESLDVPEHLQAMVRERRWQGREGKFGVKRFFRVVIRDAREAVVGFIKV
jgi:hypothetical protein